MTRGRTLSELKSEIDKMIQDRRASRLINPVLIVFYLNEFKRTGNRIVNFKVVKEGYENTVCDLIRNHLHHNFNIGGAFNDSYIQRLSSRHKVLDPIGGKDFAIAEDYSQHAECLIDYTITSIKRHLDARLSVLIKLDKILRDADYDAISRILQDKTSKTLREFLEHGFSGKENGFLDIAYGFEICMFSILKILLAKFGCKLYRDSKTYSSDKGTDISTNFGVAYQIKKKCISSERAFEELVSELLLNFADGRIEQGNVFVIIESVDDGFRKRLNEKHINCLTKKGVTDFLDKLSPAEKSDVLRQIVQEFKRELISDVCQTCRKPVAQGCVYSPTLGTG